MSTNVQACEAVGKIWIRLTLFYRAYLYLIKTCDQVKNYIPGNRAPSRLHNSSVRF